MAGNEADEEPNNEPKDTKTTELVIIFCGFVSTSDTFNITQSRLNQWLHKNIHQCSFK